MRRAIAFVVVAALAVYAYEKVYHAARPAATVPALSVADLNGKPLDTSNYKGKVLLVNFWAAWCTSCADEVPQFMALEKKYGDSGLQVIGFSVDDDPQELRDFYRKYQMNYPVAPSTVKVAEAFGGVFGLPTTVIVGRDGRMRARHEGSIDFAALDKELEGLVR